jgi:hypothetical protein
MAKLYLQAISNSVFPSSDTELISENSTIALFAIGSYAHSYKFKIFAHSSLQNKGTVVFVVKMLAAVVRRALDSDVLSMYISNAIWKTPANVEVFRAIYINIFFFWMRHMLCL